MRNCNDRSFILIPQTDRRQLQDRRAYSRGGRRAADQAVAGRESEVDLSWFWTASPDTGGADVDKPVRY